MRDRSSVLHLLVWSVLATPVAAGAQAALPQPQVSPSPEAPASAAPTDAAPPHFLDAVTVSATLNPSSVKQTPGTVSVIGAEMIERRILENVSDLVTFEPGVYVESNLTRIGANGFNIRGIGGNRVMTQVDGVETSEQFDFGPFNVHQFALDLDALKSVEIVRSAGSSLYGSDALGGVVSFFTKDPSDYLGSRRFHVGAKTTFDSRSDTASGNFVVAGGGSRAQASAFVSYGNGHETRNQGEVETQDVTRTALNPQDRETLHGVGKVVFTPSPRNVIRGAFELSDNRIETQAFSSRSVTVAGPSTTRVADITSDDTMRRWRASVDHTLTNRLGLDQWSWRLFVQRSDTDQVVDELRVTTSPGRLTTIDRSGSLEYEQETFGGEVRGHQTVVAGSRPVLLTFGGSYKADTFDMLRDRTDLNAATGAVVPAVGLILPTKYFPRSQVDETGVHLQAELQLGRLKVLPGVRYDRFTLDADSADAVFLASLSPAPADFEADRASAKLGLAYEASPTLTLHAQYAGGFRAPPYSAVNSGFTNLTGGYTSIPNTELGPETSDNIEAGVRVGTGAFSGGATAFSNAYDDFILQADRGTNADGLLVYQYQNLSKARIRGVELQAEARLGNSVRMRAAWAFVSGDDTSGSEDVPLATIAPNQGAIGLGYAPPSSRFGGDLVARLASGQSQERTGEGFVAPESYAVVDVSGWLTLTRGVVVRAGVANLTDQKYFEWANVRGRLANSATLDRYTSPGISGLVSLSVGW
jgi:hemoglobin/transferrin/lactoferrin receptor protein